MTAIAGTGKNKEDGPKTFEERYAALNAEQRQAVDTLAGPVMVIAGPGTGKTEVLTMRIANIVRGAKTKPGRILALTFTEAGAINMRRRLVELIGQDAYRVEISTFHGFANRVIRDYPDYFPHVIGGTSITEIDQVRILRRVIDGTAWKTLKPFGDRYYYLRNIMSAINELKRQGVTPEEFGKIAADTRKTFYENPDLINTKGKYEGKMKTKYEVPAKHAERNVELADVYAEYQKAILAANQYDFSDMIMYVAAVLENDAKEGGGLLGILQSAYDYYLVDEHQDTNDAQNKIIELLADSGSDDVEDGNSARGKTAGPNLFVVGDEKQAIFRFQGASIENFHYFEKKYKNVKLIPLLNNYRSTQAILDAAQAVSPRAEGRALVAKAGHTERSAKLATMSAPEVEYYFVGRKIQELIEKGAAPEQIAVLYRDNKDAAPLARMLEKLKVPFNIESDQDVLGDEEIKKLIRLLRAVEQFGQDDALVEALHVDFIGLSPMDIYKIVSFSGRQRRAAAIAEATKKTADADAAQTAETTAAPKAKKYLKLYDVLGSESLLKEAGLDPAAQKAAHAFYENLSAWKRAAKNRGAAEAFEMIVRDSGFLAAVLRNESATERLAKLHALFDLLKSFVERKKDYTLEEFFTHLDLMQEHGVAIKSTETLRLSGRVRLMTAHRAKGLEFEYVFIVGAVDRKWGSRRHKESIRLPDAIYKAVAANDDEDDAARDADERNVFYVALTRARKELFVTLAKTDVEGKEQLPTQFIAELKPDILEPLDAAPYEKEFAAHRAELEFAAPEKKTPELEDKVFLNALFKSQGISVTALNNYLECPWAYFYRNLVRIPEAPNKHLSFGNAVHAALKNYFDLFDAARADKTVADPGKAYLVQRFEEALAGEPINEGDYEEALEKGRRALPAFFAEYHDGWAAARAAGTTAQNELRIAEILLKDGTMVNGMLDRIEFPAGASVAGGAGAAARVIDYKTGKSKSRNEIEGNTASSDGNYKRQLVFYKLLLEKEGRHAMDEGVIQFIEPDDKGKFHREEFAVTQGEVNVLEAQIAQAAKEILDLSFWNKGCHKPECRYCELREGMG